LSGFFLVEMLQARWTHIDGMPVVSVFDTPFLGVDGGLSVSRTCCSRRWR